MKATEIKYLFLLDCLAANPRATHAELSAALDVPQSLVNRYLKRLAGWGAVRVTGGTKKKYTLTPKGNTLLRQASWAFVSFGGDVTERLHQRAVRELRDEAGRQGWRKAVLYGATLLAGTLHRWATEAGLEVVALCDEERRGEGVVGLDDLGGLDYDCLVLADRARAEDGILNSLLAHYAPVVNPFRSNGRAVPQWR